MREVSEYLKNSLKKIKKIFALLIKVVYNRRERRKASLVRVTKNVL